jgi:hypothetical protein
MTQDSVKMSSIYRIIVKDNGKGKVTKLMAISKKQNILFSPTVTQLKQMAFISDVFPEYTTKSKFAQEGLKEGLKLIEKKLKKKDQTLWKEYQEII